MSVFSIITSLRRHFLRYRPVVDIYIHKKNILNNYGLYQKEYPTNLIAPVLKSNGYGHGLVEVAKILDPKKPPFLIIDSIFEAYRLRHAGIKSPLLVIGYTHPENILASKLAKTEFGITAIETLEFLVKNQKKPVNIQLKFDTGMHRQGIDIRNLERAKNLIDQNQNLVVTGIFSHLSDADNTDTTFTKKQIAAWNNLVPTCKTYFKSAQFYHLAATFGAAFSNVINGNMIRLGIGLYGCNNSPHQTKLTQTPALEMKTIVTSVRSIEAGESVGYGCTFTASKPTTVATIPVGYFEGLDRRLSNSGQLKVREAYAPLAGRISMNISSLDVTDKNIKVGDVVEVIGINPNQPNSILTMAENTKTVPYELLVHIPSHLRRTVV